MAELGTALLGVPKTVFAWSVSLWGMDMRGGGGRGNRGREDKETAVIEEPNYHTFASVICSSFTAMLGIINPTFQTRNGERKKFEGLVEFLLLVSHLRELAWGVARARAGRPPGGPSMAPLPAWKIHGSFLCNPRPLVQPAPALRGKCPSFCPIYRWASPFARDYT